jgi:hypothetical protein
MTTSRGPSCPEDVRLLLREIGLLDPEEARSVDQHAATCARCEGHLGRLRRGADMPGTSADFGHIPAPLLARMPGARDALPVRARGVIDRHVEQCPTCREELELLGRLRSHPQPEARGEGQPASGAPARAAVPLWLGGYAALATAAAVLFALRPLVSPPARVETGNAGSGSAGPAAAESVIPPASVPTAPGVPAGAAPVPDETASTPAPARSGWSVRLVPRTPRALEPLTRDAGGPGAVVRRGEAAALLVRVEPLLLVADDAPIAIELLDRNGRVLSATRARWRDLHGGREFLLSAGAGALPAGSYVLRVRPAEAAGGEGIGPEAVDYPFAVSGR